VDDGLRVIEAMPFEPEKDVWAAYGARCSVAAGYTTTWTSLVVRLSRLQLHLLDPGNGCRYDALAQTFEGSGR